MRDLRSIAAVLLLGSGCTTPLSNRIEVGEEPFVIGVGEGPDRQTDLYAASANGGAFIRLTFTRLEERFPALSPDGIRVAFFRAGPGDIPAKWNLVIYDLRRNDEHSAPLPPAAGAPEALGWSGDGARLAVRAGGIFLASPATELELTPVPEPSALPADSLTRPLLGDPPAAMIRACAGAGLCVMTAGDSASPLPPDARDAIRWGGDSLGYFTARGFEVRPLAGGRSRHPVWSAAPDGLRQITYHHGAAAAPAR